MNDDTVSAVVSVYNGAAFISTALESIFSQSHPVDEIIVVDDGSTDELEPALRPFAHDITFIRQHNQGVSVARNVGIEVATGAWIALLDHDDQWLPHKQERLLAVIRDRENVAVVYSDMEVFGDICRSSRFAGRPTPRGKIFRDLLFSDPIGPSASIIRRDAINQVGGFDPTLRNCQDLDLYLRLAARWDIEYVPEVLARYRCHEHNLSKNQQTALENLYKILKNAREYSPQEYDVVWPQVRHQLAEISFELGRTALENEDAASARRWFLRSMRHFDHSLRAASYCAVSCLPNNLRRHIRHIKRALRGTRSYYHDAVFHPDTDGV